ncbi:MAG: hypothetical protein V9G19_15200 [Tetrasphaera sp.]
MGCESYASVSGPGTEFFTRPVGAGTLDDAGRFAVLTVDGSVAPSPELLAGSAGGSAQLMRLDVRAARVNELGTSSAPIRALVSAPWWRGLPLGVASGAGYRLVSLAGDHTTVVSADPRLQLTSLTVAQWVVGT